MIFFFFIQTYLALGPGIGVNYPPGQWKEKYLTIIPQGRMGSESIAHKAKGRMGYWLRGHEGKRNNCFSKIQLQL